MIDSQGWDQFLFISLDDEVLIKGDSSPNRELLFLILVGVCSSHVEVTHPGNSARFAMTSAITSIARP